MIAPSEAKLRSLPQEPPHLRGQCAEDWLPVSCSSGLQAPPAAREANHVQQIKACAVKGIDCTHVYWYLTSMSCVRIGSLLRKVEHTPLPVQDWKAQSQEQEGWRLAALAWDPAGKSHPAWAGGGRALPVGQSWARMGHLTLCCSVTHWKSGYKDQNKHRDSVHNINTS